MKLLTPAKPSELPADTLLARLRYRRAAVNLAIDQATEVPVADAVSWVYRRLNPHLRKRLEPFLDLLAMRSLVLGLRYTLAGDPPPAAVLRYTLLAEPLCRSLMDIGDAEGTVARLETALVEDYPFVTGLLATYRNQGPGGVELQLAEGILQFGLDRSRGVLKEVLSYLVDMRNCLTIHKLWRWQVSQPPALVPGGWIAKAKLQHIWASHDSDRLSRLVASLSGEPLDSSSSIAVEQCLLQGMTRRLRRAGRNPLGLGLIIEYLWRAQLAMHNQVLREGMAIDREELLGEVLLL